MRRPNLPAGAERGFGSAAFMTGPAKISVIVPCHNAAPYVSATLRSVLAQEGAEMEVIVVDDGSTDGTAEVVASAFPSVTLLRQPNGGVAAARNAGIARARHDWLAFVDADDLWLPGKLRAQLEMLKSNPAARMAYTAWQVWPSDEPEPQAQFLADLARAAGDAGRWNGASGWIYPQLLLDCVVWTSTALVHRSVLDEVGVFDPALRIGEDYDLWLRASRVTPIVRVCTPLALYRMHPASITKRLPERNYRGDVIARALRRWGYRSPDGAVADKSAVDRGLAQTWSEFAYMHLRAGNVVRARQAAMTAIGIAPRSIAGWKVLASTLMPALPRRRSGVA
jgi:glycosyltransferase involved in cell wall biosynthesis